MKNFKTVILKAVLFLLVATMSLGVLSACKEKKKASNNTSSVEQETVETKDSYACAKQVFAQATDVTLPDIGDLDVDIAFGKSYVMFDIVGGANLSHDTFEQFLAFFDGLAGWSGSEDEHSSAEYPTYVYFNAMHYLSFQVVWNSESEEGGIYLNATFIYNYFDPYSAAKNYIAQRFGINLPSLSDLSADFSCAYNQSWMTFDFTRESDFTESEYNQCLTALTQVLGTATDVSDEYQKRATFTVGNIFWDICWDLGNTVAINFNDLNSIK